MRKGVCVLVYTCTLFTLSDRLDWQMSLVMTLPDPYETAAVPCCSQIRVYSPSLITPPQVNPRLGCWGLSRGNTSGHRSSETHYQFSLMLHDTHKHTHSDVCVHPLTLTLLSHTHTHIPSHFLSRTLPYTQYLTHSPSLTLPLSSSLPLSL